MLDIKFVRENSDAIDVAMANRQTSWDREKFFELDDERRAVITEVEELQASGRYYAWDRYNADRGRLGRIVDQLTDGTLAGLSGNFESVRDHLMVENDPYLVMGDFHAYAQAWEELTSGYSDRRAWNKSALHNTAKAGFFSSDRTIAEYEADIWHIEA